MASDCVFLPDSSFLAQHRNFEAFHLLDQSPTDQEAALELRLQVQALLSLRRKSAPQILDLKLQEVI